MPTPPLAEHLLQEALDAHTRHNRSNTAAAAELGMSVHTFRSRVTAARERGLDASPGFQEAVKGVGGHVREGRLTWRRRYDEETGRHLDTVLLRPVETPPEECHERLREELRDTIEELKDTMPALPKRRVTLKGDRLFVLDPADVHIGKLSIKAETGFAYDHKIAAHRLTEGCRLLGERALRDGASRCLFVIGNDIAHIDNASRSTTSGTRQDCSTTPQEMTRAGKIGYVQAIESLLCAGWHIDLLFVPSNHDWLLGYEIAQFIGAWFRNDERVSASPYMLSERHRKYYRFGVNLIGMTHGDGAKEGDLGRLMVAEARPHIADCVHNYWFIHHVHHKSKKMQGLRPIERERDHVDMTVHRLGMGAQVGDNVEVEVVRSPSPPDSWHDRNGYINRQAVEGFVHCPHEGQKSRFTEWF